MTEEHMSVDGTKIICPQCNSKLKILYTLHGAEEDDEGIDAITIDEVQERIWFDGIELVKELSGGKE